MADPTRLRAPGTALLFEQRYRRQFLHADRQQNTAAIVSIGVALFVSMYNDFLLLRGSWLLYVAISARAVIFAVSVGAAFLMRRARWPRQQDLV